MHDRTGRYELPKSRWWIIACFAAVGLVFSTVVFNFNFVWVVAFALLGLSLCIERKPKTGID